MKGIQKERRKEKERTNNCVREPFSMEVNVFKTLTRTYRFFDVCTAQQSTHTHTHISTNNQSVCEREKERLSERERYGAESNSLKSTD